MYWWLPAPCLLPLSLFRSPGVASSSLTPSDLNHNFLSLLCPLLLAAGVRRCGDAFLFVLKILLGPGPGPHCHCAVHGAIKQTHSDAQLLGRGGGDCGGGRDTLPIVSRI